MSELADHEINVLREAAGRMPPKPISLEALGEAITCLLSNGYIALDSNAVGAGYVATPKGLAYLAEIDRAASTMGSAT